MKRKPLVTVIIPSYNHAQYITEAINSTLNQTYSNIELIIVDDASNDNTAEVLAKFQQNPKIRIIIKEKNKGQSHSFNTAIQMARGEYISILPSDDWYLPNKTTQQVEKFENSPKEIGVVYGRGCRFYEHSKKMIEVNTSLHRGNVLLEFLKNGNFVFPASPMFRRCVLETYRFDEEFSAEGEAIFTKIAGSYHFDYVNEIVAVMRAHTYNVGNSLIEKHCEEHIRWWEKYFSTQSSKPEVYKYKRQKISRIRRMHGLSLITELNEYKRSKKYLICALKQDPLLIFDYKIIGGLVLTILPTAISNIIANKYKKKETSFA